MVSKNNGAVLIFVLIVVLAMSTMVLFFQSKSKHYLDLLTSEAIFSKVDSFAELGVEIGKEIINLQQKKETTSILIDRTWPKEKIYEIDGMTLTITIKDENTCINPNRIFGKEKGEINTSLQDIFNTFFTVAGYSSTLRDSLLDWIDEDDIPRQNGAESFYYRAQGLPYIPPNKKLYTLEEMLFIREFDEEILFGVEGDDTQEEKKGLINFISIVSDGKINVNTCMPEILNAMGFTSENVKKILLERERRPLDERILLSINKEAYIRSRNLISFKSNYYSISSKVSDKEGYKKEIKVYIYKDEKKFTTLKWLVI